MKPRWWNQPTFTYALLCVAVIGGTLLGNFAFRA